MAATLPTMKKLREELSGRPLLVRVLGLLMLSCLCFYVGKRWATRYEEIVVYGGTSPSSPTESHVSIVDVSETQEAAGANGSVVDPRNPAPDSDPRNPAPDSVPLPPPPPEMLVSPSGILQEDGSIVTTEFPMDEPASPIEDDALDLSSQNSSSASPSRGSGKSKKLKFKVCRPSMKEYIPCLDNVAAIKQLPSTKKGEKWERHCPQREGDVLNCLIPAPRGYRYPIRWPKSRDEVWYSNVPHTRLVEDKGGQNWIAIKGDKFIFPGGGTQFAHGADQYLDQMAKMVPEIAFGVRTRVALDVGCGVASWGAYLMSRGVLTLSIAPKDVHENQIQFALERGVPAMVAVLATQRLLYPSQAFDIIHCSRCRIEWTRDGGILLLEVDRLLRAGGFFAWAAQPVYKHEGNLPEEWQAMYNLTKHLCWTLVAKEGYLAIWQKPTNNSCYENRPVGSQPPVCNEDDDPDNIWYVPLTSCLMQPTEEKAYRSVPDWPARLHLPPDRLQDLELDAMTAKEEAFLADQRYWKEVVGGYLRGLGLKLEEVRNVMDMNAGYGGFAAAIVDSKADWWVMNIVPVNGPNTLPVIYDRGLIGVAHDWCESFDTYPRTYDLLHASGLFTLETNRCAKSQIIIEMDRILRPAGWVLVRDSVDIINEVEVLARAARWTTKVLETESGPFGKDRLLLCKKPLWHT